MMRPRARRPSDCTTIGSLPSPGWSLYRLAAASPQAGRSGGFVVRSPRSGGPLPHVAPGSLSGAMGHSMSGRVSASVMPLDSASSGVVRLGGRRLRACSCSRGHRPSGSDSEATDRRATPPRRHLSGVGGPLTRTRLRRACRLQRPCSLPRCSCQPRIVGVSHLPQRPLADSTARTLLDRAGRRIVAWMFRRVLVGPRTALPSVGDGRP